MSQHINTKAVVGQPVAILVDLRNSIDIGFEAGEIFKSQPMQTR